MTELDATILF